MNKKLRCFFAALLLLVSIGVFAQDGLRIAEVFQHYAKHSGATMVQLSADVLRANDMTFYKSLSFHPPQNGSYGFSWVIECIDQDKRRAKKIKETILDGGLESGYYQLPQVKRGINRFILYKKGDKRKATLIYIEGPLNSADLVSLLFSK